MKRGPSNLGSNSNTINAKKAKITPSPNNTIVDLSCNNLQSGAKYFANSLNGTNVKKVNLSSNYMNGQDAKEFVEALKDTNVVHIDLTHNPLSYFAPYFAESLKGTNVTQVILNSCLIDTQSAQMVVEKLAVSNVKHLELTDNPISDNIALDLASLIEKTNLLDLRLPFTHPAISEALRKNQDRILITPYEVARLCFLPQNTKEKMMPKATFTLSENASNEEQIQYAGGILANPRMPLEIAQKIVSFLPMMNANKVRYIFNAAAKKPPVFEETEKAPEESRKPKPSLSKSKH